MADDDEDDRALARDALQDDRLAERMKFVVDGQDLLDYLRRDGPHTGEPARFTSGDGVLRAATARPSATQELDRAT